MADNIKPDHFYLPDTNTIEWDIITFLPLFDLIWSEEVNENFCHKCPLASYVHPLVTDEDDEDSYSKLCTISTIRVGLLKFERINFFMGGCGAKSDDYIKAKQFLSIIKRIPTKLNK